MVCMGNQGAPRLCPRVIVVGPAGFPRGREAGDSAPSAPGGGGGRRRSQGVGGGATLGASWGSSSAPPCLEPPAGEVRR